jgi:hypothetical protein
MQHAFEFSAEIAENFAFESKNSRQGLLTRLPQDFAPENQLRGGNRSGVSARPHDRDPRIGRLRLSEPNLDEGGMWPPPSH